MVNLSKAPFSLDQEGVEWVSKTIQSMTLKEKIGQLFCTAGYTKDEDKLREMVQKGIGGVMYRPGNGDELQKVHRFIQDQATIPLLLAADLEHGGVGCVVEGTVFGREMLVAATDEVEQAYRLGYLSCLEAAATGVNWTFSPVVDIDYNWRNPITNIRTFGSDSTRVGLMGAQFMRGAHDAGMAVSVKHFPGDGCDERDQHLHATVNDLSYEDWQTSFGAVYKKLIDKGAETIMVGHIALPSWIEKVNPNASLEEKCRPATLSSELINGLLRKELGFNGLVVSDATVMVGFTQEMPREKAVPYSIAIGMDMFLFNKDFDEDYEFMINGYKDGTLTEERLNEALTAILGLKASLGLHKKQAEGTLVPNKEALNIVACHQHQEWAKEVADKAITLVKDTNNLIPVTKDQYPRIALFVINGTDIYGNPSDVELEDEIRVKLERRGFQIYKAPDGEFFQKDHPMNVKTFLEKYDLALYVFNFPTVASNTVIRLGWKGFIGSGNNPWFVSEIPVAAISFGNPYHLIDVPRIHTYINAYTKSDIIIDAALDKLTGLSSFKGKSPVDPFCGRLDTRL